jgi:hypothetical protein
LDSALWLIAAAATSHSAASANFDPFQMLAQMPATLIWTL